ncbi:hypothetical protein O6H91_Y168500 [Diphasiastrum complanatum]|nr:hypothetical protein O6H91_Y168500 [Diphasiastrum complanatum]
MLSLPIAALSICLNHFSKLVRKSRKIVTTRSCKNLLIALCFLDRPLHINVKYNWEYILDYYCGGFLMVLPLIALIINNADLIEVKLWEVLYGLNMITDIFYLIVSCHWL